MRQDEYFPRSRLSRVKKNYIGYLNIGWLAPLLGIKNYPEKGTKTFNPSLLFHGGEFFPRQSNPRRKREFPKDAATGLESTLSGDANRGFLLYRISRKLSIVRLKLRITFQWVKFRAHHSYEL